MKGVSHSNSNVDQMTIFRNLFECPHSLDRMSHPMTDKNGHTFEKESLDELFDTPEINCPIGREKIVKTDFVFNQAFQMLIADWTQRENDLEPRENFFKFPFKSLLSSNTGEMMNDPVLLQGGASVNRTEVNAYFASNRALKEFIDAWLPIRAEIMRKITPKDEEETQALIVNLVNKELSIADIGRLNTLLPAVGFNNLSTSVSNYLKESKLTAGEVRTWLFSSNLMEYFSPTVNFLITNVLTQVAEEVISTGLEEEREKRIGVEGQLQNEIKSREETEKKLTEENQVLSQRIKAQTQHINTQSQRINTQEINMVQARAQLRQLTISDAEKEKLIQKAKIGGAVVVSAVAGVVVGAVTGGTGALPVILATFAALGTTAVVGTGSVVVVNGCSEDSPCNKIEEADKTISRNQQELGNDNL